MLVIRRAVRIEWADCDPAGIVFHPRYFEMFDTSTHHLFEAAGWKKRDLLREFGVDGGVGRTQASLRVEDLRMSRPKFGGGVDEFLVGLGLLRAQLP